eukprot:106359_1
MNSTFDDLDINRKKKKDRGKDNLRLTKSHSEMIPESTHTLKSRSKPQEVNGTKKKGPKIDAIVEMKRGGWTAMVSTVGIIAIILREIHDNFHIKNAIIIS